MLTEAGIKTLKLKGSVHQQTGSLDEFQKENLKPGDARVLLMLAGADTRPLFSLQ